MIAIIQHIQRVSWRISKFRTNCTLKLNEVNSGQTRNGWYFTGDTWKHNEILELDIELKVIAHAVHSGSFDAYWHFSQMRTSTVWF